MDWKERQKMLFLGARLAIIKKLAFLPALTGLVLTPVFRHSRLVAGILFPMLSVCEVLGLVRLARCCVSGRFDLLTTYAFSALLVLLVIATYTGLFLAAIAGRM